MAEEAQTTAVAPEPAAPEAPAQDAPAPEEPQVEQQAETPAEAQPDPKARLDGESMKQYGKRMSRQSFEERLQKAKVANTPAEPAQTPTEPKVDAQGRTHDPETGQYTAATPEASQPTPEPTPEASAPEPDGQATTEVPDGYVRIEIPESLQRNFGREQVVPEANAEFARWSINNAVRNREIEEAQRQNAELREQLARKEAEAEVYRDPAADPLNNPEVQKVYQDILRVYGEEQAQAYLRGQDKRSEVAQQKAQELAKKAKLQAASQRFGTELIPRAAKLFEAWAEQGEDILRYKLAPHLQRYARAVDQGQAEPSVDAFLDYMMRPYASDPKVQQWAKARREQETKQTAETLAQQARKQAEDDARQKEEARLKEAAERASTKHPLGRIPSAVRTDRQTMSGEPPPIDKAGKSPDTIKKEIKRHLFSGAA